MAEQNSTAATIVLDIPGPGMRVYAIAPEATAFDVETLLEGRVLQLDAMLSCVSGEMGESFRCLNDDMQENFLWACASMANEIKELYQVALPMRRHEQHTDAA